MTTVEQGETLHIIDWRDFSSPSLPAFLQAALECFVEHGYHGTSIRTIAARAGISVPGLYHHYASKHALLIAIAEFAMEDLYTRSRLALAESDGTAESRLAYLVECLVLYHAYRKDAAFISASEMRSMDSHARACHIAARDRQQRLMDDVINQGIADGSFTSSDPALASRAVVTVCTGIAQWYRIGGPMEPEALAVEYRELIRSLLRVRA